MSLYAQYTALLDGVLDDLVSDAALPANLDRKNVTVEPPRDPSHGDLAINAAMVLAKEARAKPRDLADAIAAKLRADDLISSVDVAGPGFINLTLKNAVWADALRAVSLADMLAPEPHPAAQPRLRRGIPATIVAARGTP